MRPVFALLLFHLLPQVAVGGEIKHEVGPSIMMDNADAMRALTLGALDYTYHINSEWWIGVNGFAGASVVDDDSSLVIQNGEFLWAVSPVLYFNLPALLGATKDKPAGSQAHLYTSLGVGYINFGDESSVLGIFGGGLLWESGIPWFGIRFDLKGMFYKLENTGGSDFNSDLALSIGPAFLF